MSQPFTDAEKRQATDLALKINTLFQGVDTGVVRLVLVALADTLRIAEMQGMTEAVKESGR